MSYERLPAVRGMSRSAIEREAMALIKDACPVILEKPSKTPITDLVRFDLTAIRNIELDYDFLPSGVQGITIPGDPITIRLDQNVMLRMDRGDPNAIFTGAHEAGHGVLHGRQLRERLISSVSGPQLFRKSDLAAYENPEWQANKFAGYLLVPTPTLEVAIQTYGFNVSTLASLFGVSQIAMEIRLTDYRKDRAAKSPTR